MLSVWLPEDERLLSFVGDLLLVGELSFDGDEEDD